MNMTSIDKFFSVVTITYSSALVIAFFIDTSFLMKAKKHLLLGVDAYVSFHLRQGLLKVCILKALAVIFLISELIGPSLKSGAILAIITWYVLTVIKFIRLYRKASELALRN